MERFRFWTEAHNIKSKKYGWLRPIEWIAMVATAATGGSEDRMRQQTAPTWTMIAYQKHWKAEAQARRGEPS